MSLDQCKVPKLWKESIVVPVAKTRTPRELNDFRPVALTSLVMKSFERLVKKELLQRVGEALDPMQFAYRSRMGVEDAQITLLNLLYKHLEGPGTHARLLFMDFSSAFNSIQPHVLARKLLNHFSLDVNFVAWIVDFLTCRSQKVRVNGFLSEQRSSSTGSPQGCVLSPLLYILYTNDCRSQHEDRYILKFADDTVIISLLQNDESEHGPVVNEFVSWCDEAFLQLNTSKTKDMAIDFRRKVSNPPTQTSIKGSNIEIVEQYKYLGTVIDKDLKFNLNSDMVCKKGQQRLYFLRKLNSFNVDRKMMSLFYKSFIESILTFALIAWFGNLNIRNKNNINSIVKAASKVMGVPQTQLAVIYDRQVLRKARAILANTGHPLHREFESLPSGRRFRVPRAKCNRSRNSFVSRAITLLNHDM